MKFDELEITPELLEEFRKQYIFIAHSDREVLEQERSIEGYTAASTESARLRRVIEKWKGHHTPWSILAGMKVLDLASGSGYYHDFFGEIWYPHFARLCAVNGAEVVVLDRVEQKGFDRELLEWSAVDLVDAVTNGGIQALPILQGRQFDLINSSNFVGLNWDPYLERQLAGKLALGVFENLLLEQAGELLSEGGIMTLNTADKKHNIFHYTKTKGILTQLPTN